MFHAKLFSHAVVAGQAGRDGPTGVGQHAVDKLAARGGLVEIERIDGREKGQRLLGGGTGGRQLALQFGEGGVRVRAAGARGFKLGEQPLHLGFLGGDSFENGFLFAAALRFHGAAGGRRDEGGALGGIAGRIGHEQPAAKVVSVFQQAQGGGGIALVGVRGAVAVDAEGVKLGDDDARNGLLEGVAVEQVNERGAG